MFAADASSGWNPVSPIVLLQGKGVRQLKFVLAV